MRKFLVGWALLGTLASIICPVSAESSGLLIAPTRVVFEGRKRNADVSLVNTSDETQTYRITLVHHRMTRDGAIEDITTATSPTGERFADKFLRYTPRQIVLPPGVEQVVRIQVRRPANLPEGEYRTNMLFRALPPPVKVPKGPATAVSVNITPSFAISIPIIVRQGKTSAKVTLSNLRLLPGTPSQGPYLEVLASRTGNQSVYGNFLVHVNKGNEEKQVGIVKKLAVYTPNRERLIRIPLQPPKGFELKQGKLRVTFQDHDDSGVKFAEAFMELP